ncbi:hypothetical protein LZ31DRAFT_31843 [Colletotrichum somersetense]|nr:hypothetical protein LZ31DRAFT_31843 [Colletotrichum somersetense]
MIHTNPNLTCLGSQPSQPAPRRIRLVAYHMPATFLAVFLPIVQLPVTPRNGKQLRQKCKIVTELRYWKGENDLPPIRLSRPTDSPSQAHRPRWCIPGAKQPHVLGETELPVSPCDMPSLPDSKSKVYCHSPAFAFVIPNIGNPKMGMQVIAAQHSHTPP